jgi:hypothetical protein
MIRAVQTEAFGNEEACPVPDYFLARLYRSTANEARDLCLPLPDATRARLALFCSARVHLRELARTIAATCAQSALMREGRESGRVLWEDAMRRSPDAHGFRSLRKGVTLAGPNSVPLPFLSLEQEELEPDGLELDDSEPGAAATNL